MPAKREPLIFALLLAGAAGLLISIAAGEMFLGAALAAWLIWRPRRPNLPPFVLPMCVFIVTTFLSMALSPHPAFNWAIRKTALFAMVVLAATFVTTRERARISYSVLLGVAALTSAVGLVQFGLTYARFLGTHRLADDPMILARMTGFMGHWMTFGGEEMLVWSSGIPALLCLAAWWVWPLTFVGAALTLSFTRSVWIGAAAGVILLLLLIPKRIVVKALLPIAILGAVASPLVLHRVLASFQTKSFQPDIDRIEYMRTGLQMIRRNPWFGVGPERVSAEFPNYFTGTKLPDYYGHLHNDFLQIAAERGLISFGAFLWFVAAMFAGLFRLTRSADASARWPAFSAIAALTAFVVAGLFEYNFGDSEVLLLLLFIVSIPYGVLSNEKSVRSEP